MGKYNDYVLNEFRLKGDPLADEITVSVGRQFHELFKIIESIDHNDAEVEKVLSKIWSDMRQKRAAFSNQDLTKGTAFFSQHASDIMLLLGLLSLPYCYGAAKGAEVLVRSKYILDNPERRLLETAHFVFEVMKEEALQANGNGLKEILKVRLMHAAIRAKVKEEADWDTDQQGLPINQEDMAGTNLSFSLIVIRGLRALGKDISPEEAYAYIKYWNCIGQLLGLEQSLLPATNKEAFLLDKRIKERHFEPSGAGKKLTNSLLGYFQDSEENSPVKGITKPLMNYLLGDEVSDILGLGVSEVEKVGFLPFKSFTISKNRLYESSDSYLKAFAQFKEFQKSLN